MDVVLRRSSCDSVTDKELFVGRMSLVFRLPQYYEAYALALLNGAVICSSAYFDYCDIHWRAACRLEHHGRRSGKQTIRYNAR